MLNIKKFEIYACIENLNLKIYNIFTYKTVFLNKLNFNEFSAINLITIKHVTDFCALIIMKKLIFILNAFTVRHISIILLLRNYNYIYEFF